MAASAESARSRGGSHELQGGGVGGGRELQGGGTQVEEAGEAWGERKR